MMIATVFANRQWKLSSWWQQISNGLTMITTIFGQLKMTEWANEQTTMTATVFWQTKYDKWWWLDNRWLWTTEGDKQATDDDSNCLLAIPGAVWGDSGAAEGGRQPPPSPGLHKQSPGGSEQAPHPEAGQLWHADGERRRGTAVSYTHLTLPTKVNV